MRVVRVDGGGRLTMRLLVVLGVIVGCLFTGVVPISIGIGSEWTAVNTVMSPLVCPGDAIVPVWKYKRPTQFASGPDLRTRWLCVNEKTGAAHVAGYRTIFTAGAVYGAILALITLVALRRGLFAAKSARPA
jgi:hypothetical protein